MRVMCKLANINTPLTVNNTYIINNRIGKVNELIQKFIEEHTKLCESEIEKLFMINLIYYFFEEKFDYNKKSKSHEYLYFDDFKPFYIFKGEENYEEYKYDERIDETGCLCKIIGIIMTETRNEMKLDSNNEWVLTQITNDYAFIPQYKVKIDKVRYRIDIGLLFTMKNNFKIIKEQKIAIECDGFEFHSTKEQIINDSKRTRELMKIGWKTIRYAGSEINQWRTTNDINRIVNEIKTITNS